jgi:hypothetical protein
LIASKCFITIGIIITGDSGKSRLREGAANILPTEGSHVRENNTDEHCTDTFPPAERLSKRRSQETAAWSLCGPLGREKPLQCLWAKFSAWPFSDPRARRQQHQQALWEPTDEEPANGDSHATNVAFGVKWHDLGTALIVTTGKKGYGVGRGSQGIAQPCIFTVPHDRFS